MNPSTITISLNPQYPSQDLPNSLLLSFILPSFQGTFQGHFTALCACRGTHGHEAHTPPSLLSVSMISVTRDIRTSVLINKDENLSCGLVLKVCGLVLKVVSYLKPCFFNRNTVYLLTGIIFACFYFSELFWDLSSQICGAFLCTCGQSGGWWRGLNEPSISHWSNIIVLSPGMSPSVFVRDILRFDAMLVSIF